MAETGAITAEQAQRRRGADRVPADAAAGRRLVRRLGRRTGAGAAGARTPTPCCAPRSMRGCRRSRRRGWRRCSTVPGAAAGVTPGRRGRARRRDRRGARDGRRPRLSGRARSTAPCWRAGSRAPRSSRSSGSPALEKGMTPGRHRAGRADPHRQLEPGQLRAPAIPGEITLEEALAQSINTAVGAPAAAGRRPARGGRRWRAGWASPTSCRTTPRSRSAPARSGCWN